MGVFPSLSWEVGIDFGNFCMQNRFLATGLHISLCWMPSWNSLYPVATVWTGTSAEGWEYSQFLWTLQTLIPQICFSASIKVSPLSPYRLSVHTRLQPQKGSFHLWFSSHSYYCDLICSQQFSLQLNKSPCALSRSWRLNKLQLSAKCWLTSVA